MKTDKFTRLKSERLDDETTAQEFNINYAADTVFAKNPLETALDEEKTSKKGLINTLFEKLENYADKKSKTSQIAKRFKFVLRFFKVKETLSRLNRINQSVDELVSLKVPAGEGEKRYQILADRLIRANQLRTQIQKELY